MRFDPARKLTRENLRDLPPLCADGAWGTEMQKLGAKPGELADVWNLEQPGKVLAVAKSYVDAGSQVILTNTFSSNRILLGIHGMADRAFALSKAGAEISRQAAQGRAYVFASIGPCGKMVMMGEADPGEVRAAAAEQARAFEEGGADAIVIETQSDLVEAGAALQGCLEACALPVGVSFTFDAGASNDRTMMGVSIAEAYNLAVSGGASFVGANCGAGIETFVEIAKTFQVCASGAGGGPLGGMTGSELPIWIKGNAGRPQVDAAGNVRYNAGPEVFAAVVPPLLLAGARFIGGCCGSTPDHIRAIAKALAQR